MGRVAASSTVRADGAGAHPRPRVRLAFLDNLKVALVALVVLHHSAQPYGPQDWWYVPGGRRASVLEYFTVVNGSFFMAAFFAISAYLVPAAYDRKGGKAFVLGRLKRLGLPFVAGTFTIIPVLTYVYYRLGRDYPPVSFPRYYVDTFLGFGDEPAGWAGPTWPDLQFGHRWFIQHLIVYGLLYALWRLLTRSRRPHTATGRAPSNWGILAAALAVSVGTAAIRVFYPVDRWEAVLEFIQVEIADIAQYAGLFLLGLLAYRRGWLVGIGRRSGYAWLAVGTVLAVGYYVGHGWLTPVLRRRRCERGTADVEHVRVGDVREPVRRSGGAVPRAARRQRRVQADAGGGLVHRVPDPRPRGGRSAARGAPARTRAVGRLRARRRRGCHRQLRRRPLPAPATRSARRSLEFQCYA